MEFRSYSDVLTAFAHQRVLIVGDVMVDSYIWGSVERISPEAPVPVVTVKKRDFRLGGAANVGLNIAALGAEPILCALIGQDQEGEKLKARFQERGMITEGLVTSTSRPTTVKTRVICGHQHIVRVDDECDMPATKEEENLLLSQIDRLLPDCHVVIFEDYDKGTLTPRVIEYVIAKASQLGIPTVVDPKKRNFQAYKGSTLFKPNLKELKEGLKLEFSNKDQSAISNALTQLRQELGCGAAMVTLSEQGVCIQSATETLHLPAHVREIADVSGAGDTVISIAGLCVSLGLPLRQIAALSNLGGGLVCEHVGVMPIDKADLLQEAEAKLSW
jgi:D-glycero-beta-D-manno-heptose-7-phosphate kinase